jgi:hypothetical protein
MPIVSLRFLVAGRVSAIFSMPPAMVANAVAKAAPKR